MRAFLRVGFAALALVAAAVPSWAASVSAGSLKVAFTPPLGWVAGRAPASLLALYVPQGGGTFPHLAVSEGEAGAAPDLAASLGNGLAGFFREQGIADALVLLPPRLGRSPDRVELAYSGRLGEAACDWYQVVVPGPRSGLVFTIALPRGTLVHRQGDVDTFVRSLRVAR